MLRAASISRLRNRSTPTRLDMSRAHTTVMSVEPMMRFSLVRPPNRVFPAGPLRSASPAPRVKRNQNVRRRIYCIAVGGFAALRIWCAPLRGYFAGGHSCPLRRRRPAVAASIGDLVIPWEAVRPFYIPRPGL